MKNNALILCFFLNIPWEAIKNFVCNGGLALAVNYCWKIFFKVIQRGNLSLRRNIFKFFSSWKTYNNRPTLNGIHSKFCNQNQNYTNFFLNIKKHTEQIGTGMKPEHWNTNMRIRSCRNQDTVLFHILYQFDRKEKDEEI